MQKDPMEAATDLIRRLPPQHLEQNVELVCQLAPDIADDVLATVDQPLKVLLCSKTGKPFLICDYNRDGDAYRSPWSNEYQPPLLDGNVPSPRIRKLEIAANEAFQTFSYLYYDSTAMSSVYLWDMDDGFAGAVLIKKTIDGTSTKSAWDTIHIFETKEMGRHSNYKLTSTVMLYIAQKDDGRDSSLNLAGSLTRQYEQDFAFDDINDHVPNLGRFIEDTENRLRLSIQGLYFDKMRDIVNDLRAVNGGLKTKSKQDGLQAELFAKLMNRRKD